MAGDPLPYVGDVYGGPAYRNDPGSARAGSESYLREYMLEMDGTMAYRSATHAVFDDDMVYHVGLSAPPHIFGVYGDLLDAVYDTFGIN